MEHALTPIGDDIEFLRKEIAERKRQAELENLKRELYELNIKAKVELKEFDGGLKEIDSDKILKSKNKKQHLTDVILNGFMKMMSPRPVARNLLAIGLIFFSVFCLIIGVWTSAQNHLFKKGALLF